MYATVYTCAIACINKKSYLYVCAKTISGRMLCFPSNFLMQHSILLYPLAGNLVKLVPFQPYITDHDAMNLYTFIFTFVNIEAYLYTLGRELLSQRTCMFYILIDSSHWYFWVSNLSIGKEAHNSSCLWIEVFPYLWKLFYQVHILLFQRNTYHYLCLSIYLLYLSSIYHKIKGPMVLDEKLHCVTLIAFREDFTRYPPLFLLASVHFSFISLPLATDILVPTASFGGQRGDH